MVVFGPWGQNNKETFDRLQSRHFLQALRIAVPFHLDLRRGDVDVLQVFSRQLDRHRSDVLIQAVQLRRAGNRCRFSALSLIRLPKTVPPFVVSVKVTV